MPGISFLIFSRRHSKKLKTVIRDKHWCVRRPRIPSNPGPKPCFLSECRDSNPESPVPKTGMLAVTLHSENLKYKEKSNTKRLNNKLIAIKLHPLTKRHELVFYWYLYKQEPHQTASLFHLKHFYLVGTIVLPYLISVTSMDAYYPLVGIPHR